MVRLAFSLLSLWLMVNPNAAYGADAVKARKKAKAKPKPRYVAPVSAVAKGDTWRPVSLTTSSTNTIAAPAVATTAVADLNPKRLVNLRLPVLPLFQMMAQSSTLAGVGADVDFVVSDKVSLGPSIRYTRTFTPDAEANANGLSQGVDLGLLELGAVGNFYLYGTTGTGGLVLRPHVYWVSVQQAEKDNAGAITAAASRTDGCRAGAELLYQLQLTSGFNVEVGGGFTYYVTPYEATFTDGGQARSAPDNRFAPTLQVGVGWAF